MKTLSCGVIAMKNGKILLGHATGQTHWDLPKGGIDEGETPMMCAIREMKEETNWGVSPYQLIDLGEFAYSRDKNLHLFRFADEYACWVDLEDLECNSTFINHKGIDTPEFDGYTFASIDNLQHMLSKNMYALLSRNNFELLKS